MKKLLLILFFPFCFSNVQACPACNIHNYMYESIQRSENIYVGKRLSGSSLIVVEKVLKGIYKTGDTVSHQPFLGFREANESYVFCNEGLNPGYGSLYFDLYFKEDIAEIELILKNDSVYRNDQEALIGIMGISSQSLYMAKEYFAQHHDRLYPVLIHFADSLNQLAYKKDKNLSFYEWRIENLHSILIRHMNDSAVQNYMNKWVTLFAAQGQTEKIDWHPGGKYGVNAKNPSTFYSSLLRIYSPEDSLRSLAAADTLMKRLPLQDSQGTLDLCFALLYSPYISAEKLSKYIAPENSDAFALAVYRSGILGYWNNIRKEVIRENLAVGLSYAKKPWLKKYMKEELSEK